MRERNGGGGMIMIAIGTDADGPASCAVAAAGGRGAYRPAIILSRDESNTAFVVVDIIGALLVTVVGNDDDGELEPPSLRS